MENYRIVHVSAYSTGFTVEVHRRKNSVYENKTSDSIVEFDKRERKLDVS